MRILQPFIVQILNKQALHPLQAASNHSGEKMVDLLANSEYTPPKRNAVVAINEILLPAKDSPLYSNLPEFLQIRKGARSEVMRNARNTLWMRVNWREKRDDAQFSRQFQLALPPDIPLAKATQAVVDFAEKYLVSVGMVVDFAIHENQTDDTVDPFSRTAYLMCTTRPFENGNFVNKNRTWNDRTQMLEWRRQWFDILLPNLPSADMAGQASQDLLNFAARFSTASNSTQNPCATNAVAPVSASDDLSTPAPKQTKLRL